MRQVPIVLAVMLLAGAAQAQVPRKLGYQGRLLNADGTPAASLMTVNFSVWDALSGGNKLWNEDQQLALTSGYYATQLGSVTQFGATVWNGSERYLELSIGGVPLTPRQRVGSVAYALAATDVLGGKVNASSVSIGGTEVINSSGKLVGPAAYTCETNGYVLKWNSSLADWECKADAGQTYSAGAGLKKVGVGTFALNDDPSNGTGGACVADDVLKWNGTDDWYCAPASGGASYGVATGGGLVKYPNNTTFSLLRGCGDGQLLKWDLDTTTWECKDDAGGTVYSFNTSDFLTSSGNVSLKTVDIARGGTGITSGPSAAGQYLRSTGSGQWAVGTIQSGDIEAGDLPAPGGDLGGTYGSATVTGLQGRAVASTAPNDGQVLKWDVSGGGKWVPGNAGTVTSVGPGEGLTGAAITTSGSLAVNFTPYGGASGDYGTATTVARGDHKHDLAYYTKSQVDGMVSTGAGTTRKYIGVIAMKASGTCPDTWTEEVFADLVGGGTTNLAYVQLAGGELLLGGSNAIGINHNFMWVSINSTVAHGVSKLCWKEFTTRGNPYTSLLAGHNALVCPDGYKTILHNDIKGNNNDYAYYLATEAGFFLGYRDGWDYGVQAYRNSYQYRYWSSQVQKYCLRVMGVEEDPSTRDGVFPVLFGVKGSSFCQAAQFPGFTYRATDGQLSNVADNWVWNDMNENTATFGAYESYGREGRTFNYFRWGPASTYQINYCFKFYPLTGKPHVTLKAINAPSCDPGWLSIDKTAVNGWNDNVYHQKTGPALFLGGAERGAGDYRDYLDGYIYNNFTTAITRFCLKITNVAQFP